MNKKPTEKIPTKPGGGRQASLKNLRPPWKPGEAGNPLGKGQLGRPKIADRLEKWGKLRVAKKIISDLRKSLPDAEIKDADDAWTNRVVVAAMAGQPWAADFIAERREGKVKQGVEMSGKMGLNIHDISDDELDRRIKDAARREAAVDAGASTPAGS